MEAEGESEVIFRTSLVTGMKNGDILFSCINRVCSFGLLPILLIFGSEIVEMYLSFIL